MHLFQLPLEDDDIYVVPPFEEEALYAQLENDMEYLARSSVKYVKLNCYLELYIMYH